MAPWGTGVAPHAVSDSMRRPSHIRLAATGLALAALLASLPALAGDPRLAVDWSRLAAVLVTPPELLLQTAPLETLDASTPVPWVGGQPRVSLVARDWAESRRLVGDMSLTDELRPTRSSRMVVSRVRLADGRVAPFAQLGFGEWRVDTTLLPSLPHEHELAAQGGLGFELALAPETVVALEADWTLLQPGSPSDVLAETHPALWGTYMAVRTRF
jgi:hypothetical protein